MNNKRKNRGFTLIELVVVIAILAILAAFALPRFAQLSEQAHQSSIRATGGAISAGVALARAQWVTNGHSAAVTELQGFGNDDVDINDEGWPTPTGGCADLWTKLLQSNAPEVSTTGNATDTTEYEADVVNGNCRYEYLPDGLGRYIEYDEDSGEVTTELNP